MNAILHNYKQPKTDFYNTESAGQLCYHISVWYEKWIVLSTHIPNFDILLVCVGKA